MLNIRIRIVTYSKGAGSKINFHKSQVLWLGKWQYRKYKPGSFTWVNDHLNILGIYFGNDDNTDRNRAPRIGKMETTLNKWRHRDLTLKGKYLVFNCLIRSGLAYYGSVLSCLGNILIIWKILNGAFTGTGKSTKSNVVQCVALVRKGVLVLYTLNLNFKLLK